MSLKSFLDWLREEEKKRQQAEMASLNTDVNVFKNTPANTQSSTVKSGAGTSGSAAKVQSVTAKSNVIGATRGTSKSTRNTDAIDMDWGLNTKAYSVMNNKPKKASVNKSTDMIDNDYGFNVKAMDDYLSKMRSGRKAEANKGAVIYDNVSDKIKDNKYASTMINIGKSFSNFGKYNHLNDLYYIDNPSGLDDGYKYINKDDMNKYFYLVASHEKGDVDKKDVDDLKHYLFRIGEPIDKKDADELPPIENMPDYSKISSEEQLIYDSFGNVVNKANDFDYSDIPIDDQLPKEPGKIKVDKSTDAIDRDYGLDLSSFKDMMSKIKDLPKSTEEVDRDFGLDLSQYKNMINKIKSDKSDEQLIYDSYGNVVNKPTDVIYRDYGLDLSQYKNMMDKVKSDNPNKPKREPDYSQVLDTPQYLDSEYEKEINKAKSIDYFDMPTNDQFPYDKNIAYSDVKSYNEKDVTVIFNYSKPPEKDTKNDEPADLIAGDQDMDHLLDTSPLFINQINEAKNPDILFWEWKAMAALLFSEGEMQDVVLDMIDNFKTGEKEVYSNPILTKYVSEHPSTKNYVNTVKNAIIDELVKNNGNLFALKFDESSKENNELYNIINSQGDYPKYNTLDDILGGLTMSINDTQGNDVQVLDYSVKEGKFQGTLRFHIYDHFGLDKKDVSKGKGELYVKLAGFRAWYTLQHYDKFNKKYKPFKTEVVIDVPFEGELWS